MAESGKPPSSMPDDGATRMRPLPPKAALRGVSGPYFGKLITLTGRVVIGRDPECDLVLDEPEISRKHAAIELTPGGLILRDLGSINGTFVNGSWVREARLKIGDQIGFDRDRFLIESLSNGNANGPAQREPVKHASAASRSNSTLWLIIVVAVIVVGALAWYLSR